MPSLDTVADLKPGLAVGGFVVIPIDRRRRARTIAIQPEALYVQKGLRAHNRDADTLIRVLDYIELPVLCRFGTAGRAAGLYGVAGPGVSVLVRSAGVLAPGSAQRVDFNAIAGGGISTGEFTVEARFDAGLRRAIVNPAAAQRTRTLTILLHVVL